jgi:CheY-like chemotaxis protein
MSSILVVEDEEQLRALIEKMLKPGGHQVAQAKSGKEAVRLCQERSFDLVIRDLAMPDMDGLELIRSLRSSHSDLPILAISGSFSGQFMKIPVALGAVGTLEKPFKQGDLLAKVDKVLGKDIESNDDLKPVTRVCPECAAVISYVQGAIAYAGTCPNCKTTIPELHGAMIVAFERPEKEE